MIPTLHPVEQLELFEPEHVSYHEHRLDRMPEFVYAKRWWKLNERSPGVNSGFTALEWILSRQHRYKDGSAFDRPGCVTQRDAAVAASVVQWLGTNCGMSFLIEAEREIERIDECRRRLESERRKVHRVRWFKKADVSVEPRRAMLVDRKMTHLVQS